MIKIANSKDYRNRPALFPASYLVYSIGDTEGAAEIVESDAIHKNGAAPGPTSTSTTL